MRTYIKVLPLLLLLLAACGAQQQNPHNYVGWVGECSELRRGENSEPWLACVQRQAFILESWQTPLNDWVQVEGLQTAVAAVWHSREEVSATLDSLIMMGSDHEGPYGRRLSGIVIWLDRAGARGELLLEGVAHASMLNQVIAMGY